MAFKVFTNGSVLNASEVNENLMRQSVATFSNAAARTAAITAPSEGMLTYLEDVDRYDHWNGSSWVSPFGMTLLNVTSFASASNVTINNVFTTTYDTYKIVLNVTASTANDSAFVLRAGGVNATTAYNTTNAQANQLISANVTALNVANGASVNFGRLDGPSVSSWEINNPASALQTTGVGQSFDGNQFLRVLSLRHSTASAYDGFSLTLNSTTGTIRVYGMRK